MSFRVKLSPWRRNPVWTIQYVLSSEAMSESAAKAQLYVSVTLLSAARQSFEDKQCRLYKNRFFFLRSEGNLVRFYAYSAAAILINCLVGGPEFSPQPAGNSSSYFSDCHADWTPCPCGKSDQQKPKDSPTPAFKELAQTWSERKHGLLFFCWYQHLICS